MRRRSRVAAAWLRRGIRAECQRAHNATTKPPLTFGVRAVHIICEHTNTLVPSIRWWTGERNRHSVCRANPTPSSLIIHSQSAALPMTSLHIMHNTIEVLASHFNMSAACIWMTAIRQFALAVLRAVAKDNRKQKYCKELPTPPQGRPSRRVRVKFGASDMMPAGGARVRNFVHLRHSHRANQFNNSGDHGEAFSVVFARARAHRVCAHVRTCINGCH